MILDQQQMISTTLLRYCYLSRNLQRKPFNSLSQDDILYFKSVLPSRSIVTDVDELAGHNECWRRLDKGNSSLMLLPSNTEQVANILRHCNQRRLAVVPQGGNTGLVGGSVPVFDQIIVNMKNMNKITKFNEVSAVVSCEAGVILDKLNQHIKECGFEVPLDLGAKGSCQVGGNASTNAGGKYVIKYGSFRSNILGLEAVLPNGKVLDLTSQIHKDNTGYDLKQLFISGEGTLGIITKLNIHCKKIDYNRRLLVLKTDKYQNILKVLPTLRKKVGKDLNALEYVDGYTYEAVTKHLKYSFFDKVSECDHLLFVEVTMDDIELIEEELSGFDESIISESDKQFFQFWKVREDVAVAAAAMEGRILAYDLSYQVEEWPTLIRSLRQKLKVPVLGYGHIGDGNLHLNMCLPLGTTFDDDTMFKQVAQAKGSISAEHGVGLHKPKYLHLQKSETVLDLYRGLKNLFDPNGIMNPYKVIPQKNQQS